MYPPDPVAQLCYVFIYLLKKGIKKTNLEFLPFLVSFLHFYSPFFCTFPLLVHFSLNCVNCCHQHIYIQDRKCNVTSMARCARRHFKVGGVLLYIFFKSSYASFFLLNLSGNPLPKKMSPSFLLFRLPSFMK